MERCLVRAANSSVQREDDNAETLRNRLKAFQECSSPVVDLYEKFGKVRRIDASEGINSVYEATKKAILPQIFFMIGSAKAGKSTLSNALAERTNMSVLDFPSFQRQNNLVGKSDEDQVTELIKHLVQQSAARVLIKEFPQNEGQSKYFVKNCVTPTNVFYIRCSKDDSQ